MPELKDIIAKAKEAQGKRNERLGGQLTIQELEYADILLAYSRSIPYIPKGKKKK